MKQLKLCFLLLLITTHVASQDSFILSGNINDQQGEPLLYGDVILLSPKDSLPIKYSYIQEGHFDFDPIAAGAYFLKINCLGYEEVFQNILLDANQTLKFTLSENATDLAEATITAQRNTIINNPSARYEAEGRVVLLITRVPNLSENKDVKDNLDRMK